MLGLRPDRADVILPAAQIYSAAMKWAKSEKIFVPKIGLADGLIRMMYERRANGDPVVVQSKKAAFAAPKVVTS